MLGFSTGYKPAVYILVSLFLFGSPLLSQESYFESERISDQKASETSNPKKSKPSDTQKNPVNPTQKTAKQKNVTTSNPAKDTPAKEKVPENSNAVTETEFSDFDDSPLQWGGFIRQGIYGYQSSLSSEERVGKELLSSGTRLRLHASYEPVESQWKLQSSANLDGVFSNYQDSPEFDYHWKRPIRNRLFSMETIHDEDEYLIKADVHRLWWSYNYDKLDLNIGRQSLSWGQGRLINPLDLITPSGPFLNDMEDVAGADLAHALYSFGSFNVLEVVLQPMRRNNDTDLGKLYYKDLNGLLRFKGTQGDTDYSLIGGHHFHSWVFGSEVTHTIWGASLRAAWLARHEYDLADYDFYEDKNLPPAVSHQFTLGISYAFWGKLRTNLELLINTGYLESDPALARHVERAAEQELFFSKKRDPDDQSFFRTSGRVITRQPYLIQASIDYELWEVYTPGLIVIGDPEGESLFLGPTFQWSFADEGVWAIGAYLFEEYNTTKKGDFSGLPPYAYTYVRFHF